MVTLKNQRFLAKVAYTFMRSSEVHIFDIWYISSEPVEEDYAARKKGIDFDATAWVDAYGGVAKNRLYGFGSLVHASKILSSNSSTSYSSHRSVNDDFTQIQQFEDKLCEKVEQMREDIQKQIQADNATEMEQIKADFKLMQEEIRSLRAQQPPPTSV